jgi:hypothetical protein
MARRRTTIDEHEHEHEYDALRTGGAEMTQTTAPARDPVDALVLDLLAWIGTDGRR